MFRFKQLLLIAASLTVVALPLPTRALDIPLVPKDGPVLDLAGVISSEEDALLESKIKAAREQTGSQIGILIIKSLEDESLEEYSLEVARKWGIGQKQKDNGALLLVAIDERKLRIEVGYGLEGDLTDARAGQIIRNRITPEFKNGNYYAGLSAGLNGMITAIQTETDPALRADTSESWLRDAPFLFGILGFHLIWVTSMLARTKSWWAGGLIGGVLGYVLGLIASMVLAILGMLLLGLIGMSLDYAVSRNYKLRKAKGLKPSWWAGGSHVGGSGSSSFGGFGGGSFGGGGSSGSW